MSDYIVRQMLAAAGFRRMSFVKGLPLREAKDRDAQFVKIDTAKRACLEEGIPIISVDTKKKEMVDNFKRDGQVYCTSSP